MGDLPMHTPLCNPPPVYPPDTPPKIRATDWRLNWGSKFCLFSWGYPYSQKSRIFKKFFRPEFFIFSKRPLKNSPYKISYKFFYQKLYTSKNCYIEIHFFIGGTLCLEFGKLALKFRPKFFTFF